MNFYEFQIPLGWNLTCCPGYPVVPYEIREIQPSGIAGCECSDGHDRIVIEFCSTIVCSIIGTARLCSIVGTARSCSIIGTARSCSIIGTTRSCSIIGTALRPMGVRKIDYARAQWGACSVRFGKYWQVLDRVNRLEPVATFYIEVGVSFVICFKFAAKRLHLWPFMVKNMPILGSFWLCRMFRFSHYSISMCKHGGRFSYKTR